jgi:Ca2+-binding RTX toxin-like protein
LEVFFRPDQIGAGQVSLTLAVDGSTTASPRSFNEIDFFNDNDLTDRTPVNVNLSGWTFTHWNPNQNEVRVETNDRVALNDHVVGTSVGDNIETFAGNDTIQGGRGADSLDGGDGNDTFVYGLNEAAKGEFVDGDDSFAAQGVDKVLVLANNDFRGVEVFEVEQFVFGGAATATLDQFTWESSPMTVVGDSHANTLAFQLSTAAFGEGVEFSLNQVPAIDLSSVKFQSWTNGADKVTITGTNIHDSISGSSQNDVIDGKGGSDFLQGNGGNDAFKFDTAFGHGVAHVADFTRGQDILELDDAVFTELKLGALGKKAFGFGTHATSHKEHIIFDKDTGAVRYDDDGSGKHHAHTIAVLDDVSALQHGDILVI